ncbi:MAG: efflux RND transporter periplasmic adaptor subunit [Trueperaceae bacterium]|nr:efflux RND transporter periplasmic adaptor subunit [Trueperaceae bacterium]
MTVSPARSRTGAGAVRVLVVLALLAAAAGGVWWGFVGRSGAAATDAADAAPAPVTVTLAPHAVTVVGAGTLEPGRSVDFVAETRGTVVELADVGTRVAPGDVLARLDPEPFERAIADAESALASAESSRTALVANQRDARAELERSIERADAAVEDARIALDDAETDLALQERLVELGAASRTTLEDARAARTDAADALADAEADLARLEESRDLRATRDAEDLRAADLAIQDAETALEDARDDRAAATTTASFAGVVAAHAVQTGATVVQDGTLLTVVDDATLELPVEIDETEIAQVTVGQSATLTLDALPDADVGGEVVGVAPVGRIVSNIPVFEVTVAVDNADRTLRPGMTAEAEITTSRYEATATVPLAALATPPDARDPAVRIVQRVTADGATEPVRVRLVDALGFDAVVTGDLADGDELLATAARDAATDATPRSGPGGGMGGGVPGQGPPGGRP